MQQLQGEIVQQVSGLVSGEPDLIANLSNVSALLNQY